MKADFSLQEEWRSMQRPIVDHLRKPRTSDLASTPMRMPASSYTDPVRFAAERQSGGRSSEGSRCSSASLPTSPHRATRSMHLLNAPSDLELVFGRTEALLHHYHRDLAERVGMPLP